MASVKLFKAHAVSPLLRHNERTIQNPSNHDIDSSRSDQNYSLSPDDGMTQYQRYKSRLSELHVHNRSDLNTMAEWIVTAPACLAGERDKQEQFFSAVHEFLNERYGAENEVASNIHYDEGKKKPVVDDWNNPVLNEDGTPKFEVVYGQPHLHYDFIPVAPDNNPNHDQTEKVCASSVITRRDLITFHKDLQKWLDGRLDFDAPINTGVTSAQGRNKTVYELKADYEIQQLRARIYELEKERDMDRGFSW